MREETVPKVGKNDQNFSTKPSGRFTKLGYFLGAFQGTKSKVATMFCPSSIRLLGNLTRDWFSSPETRRCVILNEVKNLYH